jgi:hypothetical protein
MVQNPEKVAGFIEVERTMDTHEVVISYPADRQDTHDLCRIKFSPRYARHLANLLIEQASYAEAEASGTVPQTRPYRRRLGQQ